MQEVGTGLCSLFVAALGTAASAGKGGRASLELGPGTHTAHSSGVVSWVKLQDALSLSAKSFSPCLA